MLASSQASGRGGSSVDGAGGWRTCDERKPVRCGTAERRGVAVDVMRGAGEAKHGAAPRDGTRSTRRASGRWQDDQAGSRAGRQGRLATAADAAAAT